jgi:predicted enzyme related to lactoylglutathione lyase
MVHERSIQEFLQSLINMGINNSRTEEITEDLDIEVINQINELFNERRLYMMKPESKEVLIYNITEKEINKAMQAIEREGDKEGVIMELYLSEFKTKEEKSMHRKQYQMITFTRGLGIRGYIITDKDNEEKDILTLIIRKSDMQKTIEKVAKTGIRMNVVREVSLADYVEEYIVERLLTKSLMMTFKGQKNGYECRKRYKEYYFECAIANTWNVKTKEDFYLYISKKYIVKMVNEKSIFLMLNLKETIRLAKEKTIYILEGYPIKDDDIQILNELKKEARELTFQVSKMKFNQLSNEEKIERLTMITKELCDMDATSDAEIIKKRLNGLLKYKECISYEENKYIPIIRLMHLNDRMFQADDGYCFQDTKDNTVLINNYAMKCPFCEECNNDMKVMKNHMIKSMTKR